MDYNYLHYRRNEPQNEKEMREKTIDALDLNVPTNEPIYVMTVELEEGSSQSIKIYSDSTPEELAFEFCKKNNLDINAMNYLTEQIKNLLEELNENANQGEIKMEHFDSVENNLHNECIQEVDEEEIGSETRKTSKTIPAQFLANAALGGLEKNSFHNSIQPIQNGFIDSLNASKNIPSIKDDIDENEILDTKELMEDDDMTEKIVHKEESKSIDQKLFSYQVVHENSYQRKGGSNKSQSISQATPIRTPVRATTPNTVNPSHNNSKVFERLFKNTQNKKWGAYRHELNEKPKFSNTHDLCAYIQRGKSNDTAKTKPRASYRDGEFINYGERLYQKGMKLKEQTMKRAESYKRERTINNANIYTYKPRINEISPEVLKKRIDCLIYNKDEYILNYNSYLEEKLDRLRKKHGAYVEYSFTPVINSNSEKIANEKLMNKILSKTNLSEQDPHMQRIKDLYDTAKLKEFRINMLSKQVHSEFNYHPIINDYSKCTESALLNLKFDERQEVCRKRSEEKVKKMKENVSMPVDQTTGQNFFSPKLVSDAETMNQRQHTSNIFHSLYSYAQKYTKNKQERENDFNSTIKKSSQSVHTTNDSEFMFYKKKEDVFRNIFKLLDGDEDDCISTLNIDIKKLPKKVKTILDPIFYELKEENETLNEIEFIRACEHLYELLSFSDKRELIEFNPNKKNLHSVNEFTFKPTIDKNSKRIAENNRCFSNSFMRTNSDNRVYSGNNSAMHEERKSIYSLK